MVANAPNSSVGSHEASAQSSPSEILDTRSPSAAPEVSRNLAWNRQRFGNSEVWASHDHFGYRWAGGIQQSNNSMARVAEAFLLPHLKGHLQRGLRILELACGAGRFTTELVRLAHSLCLVDMNPVCLDVCRSRFKFYEGVEYYANDGVSLDMVPTDAFDLIASFDSLVHVHPEIVRGYVEQSSKLLKPGALIWFDHSGKGANMAGTRSAMTDGLMREFAESAGLEVVAQYFRNEQDCISVLRRPLTSDNNAA